jgi:hypothetical protein
MTPIDISITNSIASGETIKAIVRSILFGFCEDIAAAVKRIEVGFAADTAAGIVDIAVAADIAFVEVVAASCFLET